MILPQITSDLNKDPLLNEIKQPTIKAPTETTAEISEPKPDEPAPDPADFDKPEPEQPTPGDPLPEDPTTAQINELELEPGPGLQPQQPTIKKKMSAELSAEMIVALEDNLQQLVLPPLYQKSLFTAEEKKLIREYKFKALDPDFELPEEHRELMSRYDNFKEIKDLLPMDGDEKKTLTDCWTEIIKQNPQLALSPWGALITAHAAIFGPRLLPLLNKLSF